MAMRPFSFFVTSTEKEFIESAYRHLAVRYMLGLVIRSELQILRIKCLSKHGLPGFIW